MKGVVGWMKRREDEFFYHLFMEDGLKADEKHKEAAEAAVRKALYEAGDRVSCRWYFPILTQLKFTSWGYWMIQALLFIGSLVLIGFMKKQGAGAYQILGWTAAAASFLGVNGVNQTAGRSSLRMAELEQSCYFNLKQLFCIRMAVFTGVNFVLLLFLAFFVGAYRESMLATAVYICVPFLFCNVLHYGICTLHRERPGGFVRAAAAVLTGISFALILPAADRIYAPRYFFVWAAAFLICLAVLAAEMKSMMKQIEKGEGVCWN